MTTQAVKKLIGKIATDDVFKERFFESPAVAIKESGYAIDEQEGSALAKLKREDITFDVERKVIDTQPNKSEVEFGVTAVKKFKGRGSEIIKVRDSVTRQQ